MTPMRRPLLTAFGCAAAACALAAPAGAVTVTEVGDFKDVPLPPADCPGRPNTSDCQSIAQLTGFQVQVGKHSVPYKIRKPGYVIAFTLRLSKPDASQVSFFKTTYGDTPEVRLSVIRQVGKSSKKEYKLLKQTQPFKMEPYFQSTQSYALHTPFRVHKDDIVAITAPSWLPAFAHSLPSDNAWRTSHSGSECTASTPPSAAQEKIGSTKVYGCFYRGARVLYSVTYVPDAQVTNTAAAR